MLANNPFTTMLSTFQPKRFFGRAGFCRSLLESVTGDAPGHVALTGIHTVGKTSLLRFLCHPEGAQKRYSNSFVVYKSPDVAGQEPNKKSANFLYVDLFQIKGTDVLDTLHKRLTESGLVDRYMPSIIEGQERPSSVEHQKKDLDRAIKDSLANGLRLVVCFDHFGETSGPIPAEQEVYLRALGQQEVSFLIATEISLDILKLFSVTVSPFVNTFRTTMKVGLLTEEEADLLIEEPCAQDSGSAFTKTERQFLREAAGRQPYLLTVACQFLFDKRIGPDGKIRSLPDDPTAKDEMRSLLLATPEVRDLFEMFWHQMDDDEKEALARIVAKQPDPRSDPETYSRLQHKALIDPYTGEVFSELFASFVKQQQQRAISPRKDTTTSEAKSIFDQLTGVDRQLLLCLTKSPNTFISVEDLLGQVWGSPNHTVDALYSSKNRINAKLRAMDGAGLGYIENKRGLGYRLVVPGKE